MKHSAKVVLMAVALIAGMASAAEAIVTLQVRICQGAICQDFGPSPGPGPFTNNNITVGDFTINGSVSSLENALLSNSATVTIAVQRVSLANDAQGDDLTIWLNASGYQLPIGQTYTFNTTLGGTSSGAPAPVTLTGQGWLSTNNATGFPPIGPNTFPNAPLSCPLGAPTDSCNQDIATIQTPANQPFSLTTRTTFSVANASAIATYTSNMQANVTAQAVIPEPATMLLLGAGLAAGVRRRFRRT